MTDTTTAASALERVRVWDLPTRVFHWLLAATVIGSVVSAKIGGNAMLWHTRLGLLALALLVFRIVWGFVGGRWSRFASFVYGPSSMLAYLRGDRGPGGRHDVGHSPLGAASVFAMLAVLLAQVATGLVADDEIATTGPLNRFVSNAVAGRASSWHEQMGQWLIIGLVALHIGAVLFYLLRKKRNLIAPMIQGDAPVPLGTPPAADAASQRVLALVILAAAGALSWWIGRFGA